MGTNKVNPTSPNTWIWKDNLFHSVTMSTNANALVNGCNGYSSTTALLGGTNVTGTASFVTGPLGKYYQSTTTFKDKGSRNADVAGLYHYTTGTATSGGNQIKEQTSLVDLGFHYLALNANNLPIDSDGDGISDYLEDRNGNGTADSGETDWQSSSTFGGGANGALQVYTPLRN
jgi:hypothetical protein